MAEFVLTTIFAVIAAPMSGWVFSIMWAWFVMPIFHLPALTIPQAIGIMFTVGMLTKQNIDVESPKRDKTERLIRTFALAVIAPLFTLLLAWIVKLFL
jgi:hypothetical protein